MKKLLIVRHAKSRWDEVGLSDHDRGLNQRGLKAAPLMAKRLAAKYFTIDHMLASTAKRASHTAQLLMKHVPTLEITYHPSLYATGVHEIIDLLQQQNDEDEQLAVVGHNPELTMLVNYFCPDADIDNMPTCAMVQVQFDVDHWANIERDCCQLVWFDYPKNKA